MIKDDTHIYINLGNGKYKMLNYSQLPENVKKFAESNEVKELRKEIDINQFKDYSLEKLIELAMEQNIIIGDVKDNEWVSVNERLPNELEPVLVYHSGNYPRGYNNMQTAYWRNDAMDGEPIEVDWTNADSGMSDVTHWMPLPQLPVK